MERVQGCLTGRCQHSWWVLWDDSQHIETLIDWAQKVLDDMGRMAQRRFGKVCLHHSSPLFSLSDSAHGLLVFCESGWSIMLIRPGTEWIQS